jgi:hypothetical protein
MNLSSLLPHVPLAAISLLVIVGGLIAFEIYSMLKSKRPKKQKKEDIIEGPDTMQPLKFPKITNPKINKKKSKSSQKLSGSAIAIISGISFTILAIGIGLYYIKAGSITINIYLLNDFFSQGFQSTNEPATPTNDIVPPSVIDYDPKIILYRETPDNKWVPLDEEDLSTLQAGNVIRIAVKTEHIADRVEIFVNEELVNLSTSLTPDQDPYARYTIPKDKSEYKVAARVY